MLQAASGNVLPCGQWPDQGHPIEKCLVMADVTVGREPGLALAWVGETGRKGGCQLDFRRPAFHGLLF